MKYTTLTPEGIVKASRDRYPYGPLRFFDWVTVEVRETPTHWEVYQACGHSSCSSHFPKIPTCV